MRKVPSLQYGPVVVLFFSWLTTGLAEGANEVEGNNLSRLPGVFVASNEKNYQPCKTGPGMLRSVDAWERANNKLALMTIDGQSVAADEAAEMMIAECSQDLANISAMASGDRVRSMSMIRDAWKEDLEFMKWWLKNRHQKLCPPQPE